MTLCCPECGSSKHLSRYGRKWRMRNGRRVLVQQYICWRNRHGCGRVTTKPIRRG